MHEVRIVSNYNEKHLQTQIKKILENLDEDDREIVDVKYCCCYNTKLNKVYHTICIIWSY